MTQQPMLAADFVNKSGRSLAFIIFLFHLVKGIQKMVVVLALVKHFQRSFGCLV